MSLTLTHRWICVSVSTMAIPLAITACCATTRCPESIVIVTTPDSGVIPAPSTTPDPPADADTEPPDDGGSGSTSASICESACRNLATHRCPEAVTRPGEDSCVVVCQRAQATRGRIDLKPRCIAAAKSRAAILACGTYRCM